MNEKIAATVSPPPWEHTSQSRMRRGQASGWGEAAAGHRRPSQGAPVAAADAHLGHRSEVAYLVFVETVAQNPDVQTSLEEVLQHRSSCHLVNYMRSFSHREQVSNSDHSAKFERFERGPRGVEGLLCSLVKCHLTIHNEDVVDVNLQRIQAPETQI